MTKNFKFSGTIVIIRRQLERVMLMSAFLSWIKILAVRFCRDKRRDYQVVVFAHGFEAVRYQNFGRPARNEDIFTRPGARLKQGSFPSNPGATAAQFAVWCSFPFAFRSDAIERGHALYGDRVKVLWPRRLHLVPTTNTFYLNRAETAQPDQTSLSIGVRETLGDQQIIATHLRQISKPG
jgi:hypothetical protein